ncbi:hypothetical protein [Tautonia plasticadhaerens]|uniref:Knr4/Smi1-like domain-containing protein n=1 Tax=Tautonia plasticadhaerens TaxID=2527974 RepID=A0A518H562_9BACT|nr:hypothetical protein [Tautonia plasticadhaerens]QDV35977.1 hypothetical protein ElP_38870 [Tautonia plasticadhaerens]
MSFDDTLTRCIARWQEEGIPLAPPIGAVEVRRAWERLGHPVSRDVIQLYGRVGGCSDYHFDEEYLWCLWTLSRIVEQNDRGSVTGVQFCDHSIQVVTWELHFENEEHSSVWQVLGRDPGDTRMTSPDLDTFFRTYLDDPWRLL